MYREEAALTIQTGMTNAHWCSWNERNSQLKLMPTFDLNYIIDFIMLGKGL